MIFLAGKVSWIYEKIKGKGLKGKTRCNMLHFLHRGFIFFVFFYNKVFFRVFV